MIAKGEREKTSEETMAGQVFVVKIFVILKRRYVDTKWITNINTLPEATEIPKVKKPKVIKFQEAIRIHPSGA